MCQDNIPERFRQRIQAARERQLEELDCFSTALTNQSLGTKRGTLTVTQTRHYYLLLEKRKKFTLVKLRAIEEVPFPSLTLPVWDFPLVIVEFRSAYFS